MNDGMFHIREIKNHKNPCLDQYHNIDKVEVTKVFHYYAEGYDRVLENLELVTKVANKLAVIQQAWDLSGMMGVVVNNASHIKTVSQNIDSIDSVAVFMSHIIKCSNNEENINDVVNNLDLLNAIKNNMEALLTINAIANAINIVANRKDEIVEVFLKLNKIVGVYDDLSNIDVVHSNLDAIISCAKHIEQLVALATNLNAILNIDENMYHIFNINENIDKIINLSKDFDFITKDFKESIDKLSKTITNFDIEFLDDIIDEESLHNASITINKSKDLVSEVEFENDENKSVSTTEETNNFDIDIFEDRLEIQGNKVVSKTIEDTIKESIIIDDETGEEIIIPATVSSTTTATTTSTQKLVLPSVEKVEQMIDTAVSNVDGLEQLLQDLQSTGFDPSGYVSKTEFDTHIQEADEKYVEKEKVEFMTINEVDQILYKI